jgi:uncharacterized protein (DUF2141 family)
MMNFGLKVLCTILLCLPVLTTAADIAETSGNVLTVTVNGFAHTNGTIRLALWNSPKTYTDAGKALLKTEKVPVMPSVTFVITNLPNGEYTFGVYHDENGNKQMDKNLFGKPVERYGISNNALGMFGPAKYKKAKFTLAGKGKKMKITVQ